NNKRSQNNRLAVMTQVFQQLRQPQELRVSSALADLRTNTDGLNLIAAHTSPELKNWLTTTDDGPETLSVVLPAGTGGLSSAQTLALAKPEVAEIMKAAYVDFEPDKDKTASQQINQRKRDAMKALRLMPSSKVNDLFKGNSALFTGMETSNKKRGNSNRLLVMTQVFQQLRRTKELALAPSATPVPSVATLRQDLANLRYQIESTKTDHPFINDVERWDEATREMCLEASLLQEQEQKQLYLFYTAKQAAAANLEATIAEREAQMLQGQNKRPGTSTPTAPQSPDITPSEQPNKRQRLEQTPQPQPEPSDKDRTTLSPAPSWQNTRNDMPPDQGARPSGAGSPPQSPNVPENLFGLDPSDEEDEIQKILAHFQNRSE
ncbi:hypothetical protein, partial [uncultured Tateyamaria sp.]|uniref:hypothetical protein n=1 Tax=uncultured Tateyamaria sp. TaxID=455651 RepID=UPI002606000F